MSLEDLLVKLHQTNWRGERQTEMEHLQSESESEGEKKKGGERKLEEERPQTRRAEMDRSLSFFLSHRRSNQTALEGTNTLVCN